MHEKEFGYPSKINRRSFLKIILVATGVGVAVGSFEGLYLSNPVDKAVEKATGHPTGNAGVIAAKETCSKHPEKCPQELSKAEEAALVTLTSVIGPVVEETVFRAVPSIIVSKLEGKKDPINDAFFGTGEGLGMTRRELIAGALTSLIFGAGHNFTSPTNPTKFDTEVIPASQTVGGILYWYLQRKLGVFANTSAHITELTF